VREERSITETGVLLKNMPETTIRNYLNSSVASADVKAGLTKAQAIQAKIVETMKEIAEVKTQLEIVTGDHNRVRENLKIVPPSSEHYKAFLEKFVAQDKQIETYQGKLRELNTALAVQGRDYDQFLAKLDAE
jgi:dynactin complex subunit